MPRRYIPLKPVIVPGRRYGRLRAIDPYGYKKRRAYWRFRCDCGKERIARTTHVLSGATRSCGCYRNDQVRKALTTHGKNKTAEHKIWIGMINRCENPRNKLFKWYGQRGISVCPRWRYSFARFLADMGPRPSAHYSLDRYPNKHGNYEPNNCRWATDTQQARNRTGNRIVTYLGQRMTLAEAAERAGLKYDTVWARLKRGWSPHRALTPL